MAALQKYILAAVLGLTLVACGGGGGTGGTILTGGTPVGGADEDPELTATISLVPRQVTPGVPSVATITVLRGNEKIEDAAVSFSASLGSLSPNEGNVFTDDQGQASVNLLAPRVSATGTLSANVTVGAENIGAVPLTYIVSFEAPVMTLELLDNNGEPTNNLVGFEQATVRVTLTNSAGPLVGEVISLSTDQGQLGQSTGLTDANGQVITRLTANNAFSAGSLTATSTLDLTTVSASLNYQVNEQNPGLGSVNLQFSVDQVTIAPLTQSTARVRVTRSDNTPVEGAIVNFSASLVQLTPASGSVFTNADGVAEISLRAGSTPGDTQISVEVLIAEERFAPPPINLIVAEALIELTLSDNVVQANEQIEVQARLVEATELRTPIPNTVVEVSTTIGTFSIASGLTDATGLFTFTMVGGAEAGEGTITALASIDGNPVVGRVSFQNVGEEPSDDNSLALTVSGLVDAGGNPDNVLAGNETALITAEVIEDGERVQGAAVIFTTNQGRLSSSSVTTDQNGQARVNLTGIGVAGAAIVEASVVLGNGVSLLQRTTIQTSAERPTLRIVDVNGVDLESLELSAAQAVTIKARVADWDGTAVEDIGVTFSVTAVETNISSGRTVAGDVDIVLTGTQTIASGTFTAQATFGSFPLSDQIVVTSLGVNASSDSVTIDRSALSTALGSNVALDGNEKVDVAVTVVEGGVVKQGITVLFSSTGVGSGTLVQASDVTDASGVANVRLIGKGVGGTTDITVNATLDNGIDVTDTFRIQTSAIVPTISLVLRNDAGAGIEEFSANDALTVEATILDFDGTVLDADDQRPTVRFALDNLQIGSFLANANLATVQDVAEVGDCPVVGAKSAFDCAFASFFASTNSGVGAITATTTINGIAISDVSTVSNTGVSSDLEIQRQLITAALGTNIALDGNEKIDIPVRVSNNGNPQAGITVVFTSTGGTLVASSEVTGADGSAKVGLIGLGVGGTITITATATLENNVQLSDSFTIQSSARKPTIQLVGRDSNGAIVDSFAANQQITLEAVVRDYDGAVLDADDRNLDVTFRLPDADIGSFNENSTLTQVQKVTAQNSCLAGAEPADCATVTLYGGSVADVSTLTASATVNGISISSARAFTNTGVTSVLRIQESDILNELGANAALDGNEKISLYARVTDSGASKAGITVVFTSTAGTLLQTSSVTGNDGIASVQLIGDGVGGTLEVRTTVELDGGIELSDRFTIQTSAIRPVLELVVKDSGGNVVSSVGAGQQLTLEARVRDFDVSDLDVDDRNPVVTFGIAQADLGSFNPNATVTTTQSVAQQNVCTDSGVPVSADCASATLTASNSATVRAVTATATINGIPLSASRTITNSGVDTTLEIQEAALTAALGANGALDGNEKVDIDVVVRQAGVVKDGVTVLFTTSGSLAGLLVDAGAVTGENAPAGTARLQLIGQGVAGSANITATATLSNNVVLTDTFTIQTSSVRPVIDLTVRNGSGEAITQFGANQTVTLEATIVNFDGTDLAAEDQGLTVSFVSANTSLGSFSPTNADVENRTSVAQVAQCPLNGINAGSDTSDCATARFYSSTVSSVGTFTASVTVNGVVISDSVTVTNTAVNSGSPDQNSFTITRIKNGQSFGIDEIVSIEGDRFNNEEVQIRVDLADFFNNPVPEGTLVEFTTELGDVTPSCLTSSGTCQVTFTSGEPRAPDDSEVRFKTTFEDACPSQHITDEIVVVSGANVVSLDYRVAEILRVIQTGGDGVVNVADTTVVPPADYTVTANGLICTGAQCFGELAVTYRRLWLDEEDDGLPAHVLLNPGKATAPFLAVTDIPCLAHVRQRVERISGSINPAPNTTIVQGSGTSFLSELAVNDYIKVSGEVRRVTAITNDTQLTIASSFSDNLNDTSPERIAAPAYLGGLGQPYGGRSTVLAYAVGEESFTDVNGNDEYDYGEPFFDLPEAFLDKNEDGVLGDITGDSDTVGTNGPYRDAGLGLDPPGQARDKSAPNCYGPRTIVGANDGVNDSTEQFSYCYQGGGEEEQFIDFDLDGFMDTGNGRYNGSRCLRPKQGFDLDNDGTPDESNGDDDVCTTDLLNVSRSVQILMAGSFANDPDIDISFRSDDSDGGTFHGGTFYEAGSFTDTSGGELISRIVAQGGVTNQQITNGDFGSSASWSLDSANAAIAAGKASINSATEEDLLSQNDVFVQGRDHAVSVNVVAYTSGNFTILSGGTAITTCGAAGNCTGSLNNAANNGNFKIITAGGFVGELDDISVISTTRGQTTTYSLPNAATVRSNDNTIALNAFEVGDTIDAATVFPGVSERLAVGLVYANPNANNGIVIDVTDKYNGQMPEGTVVTVTSDNSVGCLIESVQGVKVDEPNEPSVHSGSATVGRTATTRVYVTLGPGAGAGPLEVEVSTLNPDGTVGRSFSTQSITCDL